MRRRHDAHVDRRRLRRADADDLVRLEHAQQLRLQLQRQLADLVEEHRAAVGALEHAGAPLGGAGERALLVPEQLRLDQRRRHRRAVDHDERPRRPPRRARAAPAPPAPCRCPSRPGSAPSRRSAPRARAARTARASPPTGRAAPRSRRARPAPRAPAPPCSEKRSRDRAALDDRAVVERRHAHAHPADARAVGRPQVHEHALALADVDAQVAPRHVRIGQHQVAPTNARRSRASAPWPARSCRRPARPRPRPRSRAPPPPRRGSRWTALSSPACRIRSSALPNPQSPGAVYPKVARVAQRVPRIRPMSRVTVFVAALAAFSAVATTARAEVQHGVPEVEPSKHEISAHLGFQSGFGGKYGSESGLKLEGDYAYKFHPYIWFNADIANVFGFGSADGFCVARRSRRQLLSRRLGARAHGRHQAQVPHRAHPARHRGAGARRRRDPLQPRLQRQRRRRARHQDRRRRHVLSHQAHRRRRQDRSSPSAPAFTAPARRSARTARTPISTATSTSWSEPSSYSRTRRDT